MKILPRNHYKNMSIREFDQLSISDWQKAKILSKLHKTTKYKQIFNRILWYLTLRMCKDLYHEN